MEDTWNFLETSTIHGLLHITRTNRGIIRLFWLSVVFIGFSGAGIMIHKSLKAWDESPVKTTIETRPITELTFPKITVCPPKNTFTDLNYHLLMSENMTIDNNTRKELTKYARTLMYDYLFEIIMMEEGKLEYDDYLYNLYNGYGYIESTSLLEKSKYTLRSFATSGTISTQYFGEEFDANKIETQIHYEVIITPPEDLQKNKNVSLHFEIDKISMTLSEGDDNLYMHNTMPFGNYKEFKGRTHFHVKIALVPGSEYKLRLVRRVNRDEVKMQTQHARMPGFRLKWYYTGNDVEAKPKQIQFKSFIRNDTKIFQFQRFYTGWQKFQLCAVLSLM